MCCLGCRFARRGHRRGRRSTVSRAGRSCQPTAPPIILLSGLLGDSVTCHRAQSREREANNSESSAAERNASTATRGCWGVISSAACSLTPKSQANLVWSVSPGSFAPAKAGRSHGYGAGLALGDMRSIAPILLLAWPGEASRPLESLGAPELFLTVLPVCGRRNERSGSLLHL